MHVSRTFFEAKVKSGPPILPVWPNEKRFRSQRIHKTQETIFSALFYTLHLTTYFDSKSCWANE